MNNDIDMYNGTNYHCSVTAGKESGNIHRTEQFLAMDSNFQDSFLLLEWNSFSCNFTQIIHHEMVEEPSILSLHMEFSNQWAPVQPELGKQKRKNLADKY